ncbi:MAG: molybdopterin-dependent oxidoreductase, partial [Deltaproteobacteria bacterium]|nr:molybdopterin-dependent oxidoreductase [Deltaproteobacteria bacterium]
DPRLRDIPGLAPRITPNELHYTVDEYLIKPFVDPEAWRLEVRGHVDRPFTLTYEELLDLESVEQPHTLQCISNEVGGPLIGTALWTGVPLRGLLARAGVKPGAFDVVFRSVDDYSDSIPLDRALDPGTLLAYLMNGRTLPREHGYPLRVLVPEIYGIKNVKWLRTIEVATFDFRGYWQERGWSDLAIVNTTARIDVPDRFRAVRRQSGEVLVAGIANASVRGIAKVEVSFDRGATWTAADLEAPAGPFTWRRWSLRWRPPGTGRHSVTVRASDGAGRTQSVTKRPPFPDGSTGYDEFDVAVEA